MDAGFGVADKAQHEFLYQFGIEGTNLLRGDVHLIAQSVPPAEIHGAHHQGFVHGQKEIAVAHDALFIAQRFRKRLTESDADVLHGMVIVHLNVALTFYRQIELTVKGQQLQHVVEKPHAGVDVRLARAVQVQFQGDLGFFGVPFNGRLSHVHISFVASISFSICSRLPMVMRVKSRMRG